MNTSPTTASCNRLRRLSVPALAVVGLTTLAACGGGSSTTTTTAAADAAPAESADAAPASGQESGDAALEACMKQAGIDLSKVDFSGGMGDESTSTLPADEQAKIDAAFDKCLGQSDAMGGQAPTQIDPEKLREAEAKYDACLQDANITAPETLDAADDLTPAQQKAQAACDKIMDELMGTPTDNS